MQSVTVERNRSYDPLAWFYDHYWGREYHQQVVRVLETLLLAHIGPGAHLLDLACGAGHLTRMLVARGYRVTGLDSSSEMLRFARANVPDAELLTADARDFHLQDKYDACVSTFEAINHIPQAKELAQVFQNVDAALKPGGVMVFDVLDEQAYCGPWGKAGAAVEADNAYFLRGSYDPATRQAQAQLTLFRLEGVWQRTDVAIAERCYTPDEIRAALASSRLGTPEFFDARTLGMSGDLAIGRTFIRTRREGDTSMQ